MLSHLGSAVVTCILHPKPYTLHPAPCTLNSAPYTLQPAPCTLHPARYALHPISRSASGLGVQLKFVEPFQVVASWLGSGNLHPAPYTGHPAPSTLHPAPCTLHPTPYALNPAACTLRPAPYTLHPTPHTLHPSFTLHHTPYTLRGAGFRFRISGSRLREQGSGFRVWGSFGPLASNSSPVRLCQQQNGSNAGPIFEPPLRASGLILCEKRMKSKLCGNEVYCTACS